MTKTEINLINYRNIKNKAIETYYILNLIPHTFNIDFKEEIFIQKSIKKISEFINCYEIKEKDITEIRQLLNILNKEYIFNYYLTSIEKRFCERELIKYEENPESYTIPELNLYIENGEFLKAYISYRISNIKENKDNSLKLTK